MRWRKLQKPSTAFHELQVCTEDVPPARYEVANFWFLPEPPPFSALIGDSRVFKQTHHERVPALEIELRRSLLGAERNATSRNCLSIGNGQQIIQPQLAKKGVPFLREIARQRSIRFVLISCGQDGQGSVLHGGTEAGTGGFLVRRSSRIPNLAPRTSKVQHQSTPQPFGSRFQRQRANMLG